MFENKFARKRLLHFFSDEKVVNDAIESFEAAFPNENLFLVLLKDGRPKLVKPHNNVFFISYNSRELENIIRASEEFVEVIFHSMTYEFSKIIKRMSHPNITWIVWGADLYEGLLYRKGYQLYLDDKDFYRVKSQNIPVPLYKLLLRIRDNHNIRMQLKATNKIHNVCALKEDFYLFVKYYPEFENCKHKSFFYYPIEKMLDNQTRDAFVSGNDLWVNNAASYNGNHIGIFRKLSKFEHLEHVNVPLSYGIPICAKHIENEGRKILGDKFAPLMTFLPKEEYYKKFLGSNSFVFGHLRQCAFGNIVIALYLGAKVFLFKENPLYDTFNSQGAKIYNIDNELTEENVYIPLPEEDRMSNRRIMMENYNYKRQIKLIKENF